MIFFWIYIAAAFLITLYCLNQFYLLILSFKKKSYPPFNPLFLPKVAIQLPVYNEKLVIQRLIESTIDLEYPKQLLEIQILDDSNDETSQICAQLTTFYRSKGWNIQHLKRNSREGFKAGALEYGLQFIDSQFIAIFDADFIPPFDFLKKTIGFFDNPQIGVVQSAWSHLNENYSLLTKVQAFQLNIHFAVEQKGRFQGNYFSQFNGTAGVWRKKAIIDAGGWQKDTLTEDLDLSIRTQLKGWKIIQFTDLKSPAELPYKWEDFKNQQFRWIKGGTECWFKLIQRILLNDFKISKKIQAIFQLSGSLVYILILLMAISSLGLLLSPRLIYPYFFYFFQMGIFSLFFVYALPWIKEKGISLNFFLRYTFFLIFTTGISLSNSKAVLLGLFKISTPFTRTPKYGLNPLITLRKIKPALVELIFGLIFSYAFIFGLTTKNYDFLMFHFLLSIAYLISFYFSVHPKHN